MRSYEIRFPCLNSERYPKWITAYVAQPGALTARTGAMLFIHGWGCPGHCALL